MKRFIEGDHRGQGTLLPELLDDYVSEDNPVRVVDVFVKSGMVAAIRAYARFLKRFGLLWGVTILSWLKSAEIVFGATGRLRPLQY